MKNITTGFLAFLIGFLLNYILTLALGILFVYSGVSTSSPGIDLLARTVLVIVALVSMYAGFKITFRMRPLTKNSILYTAVFYGTITYVTSYLAPLPARLLFTFFYLAGSWCVGMRILNKKKVS